MAFLDIENLRKSFGAQNAVQNFDLAVARGAGIILENPQTYEKVIIHGHKD